MAVEKTQLVHPSPQLWYLDDGILWGTLEALRDSALHLEREFKQIGLTLNWNKCEIYSLHNMPTIEGPPLRSTVDPQQWSYLGAPLASPTAACVVSARSHSLQVNSQLVIMTQEFPMEALILARGTSGACRVTHITGSCHSPQLEECLLSQCSR